jgi:Ca2+-binding EF-hand superfamily protein
MTSISSVSSSAWSGMGMQRSQRAAPSPERLMSKIDTDQSGGVNDTELQGLLDKVAEKTGTQLSAADVLTQFDADGNGQLSSDELGKTMQSILPPPSTMDFAQQRASGSSSADGTAGTGEAGDDLFAKVDTDGDNAISSTELQALLEAMSGGTASQTGVSSDDAFSALDSDGDGSLTQAEFDAGRPTGQGGPGGGVGGPGGMPPPPPAGAAQGSNSSTASTEDDALDTNGDGVVSLSERLAGQTSSVQQDAVAALFQSIDTDGDQQISSSESSAFIQALTSAYGSSATSSTSAQDGASTASSPRGELMHLAELARQRYAEAANAWSSSTSSSALSAVA